MMPPYSEFLETIAEQAPARLRVPLERASAASERFQAVAYDALLELECMESESIDCVITGLPNLDAGRFAHSIHDLGWNASVRGWSMRLDFLAAVLLRVIRPGGFFLTYSREEGLPATNPRPSLGPGWLPVPDLVVAAAMIHGWYYRGRLTVVSDVADDPRIYPPAGDWQPYYVVMLQKPGGDSVQPVPAVRGVSLVDESRFWRSRGDRFLTLHEAAELTPAELRRAWAGYSLTQRYNWKQHQEIAAMIRDKGPLRPQTPNRWIWPADAAQLHTKAIGPARLERHVRPMPIDLATRLVLNFSRPGDLILDPFAGIGTVGVAAVREGRRASLIELHPEYWREMVGNLHTAFASLPTLFEALGV